MYASFVDRYWVGIFFFWGGRWGWGGDGVFVCVFFLFENYKTAVSRDKTQFFFYLLLLFFIFYLFIFFFFGGGGGVFLQNRVAILLLCYHVFIFLYLYLITVMYG